MDKRSTLIKDGLISLAAGLVIGLILAAFSAPPFFQALFGAFVLTALSSFGLIRAWRGMGVERSLAIIMLVSFFIHIFFGILFYSLLPTVGYDTPVQNAGYIESDAYERDTAAIQLVQSGESIFAPFLKQVKSDQYGGLLTISALVYMLFSPDAARPLLITLLASFVMTAGLAFFWSALKGWFSERFTLIAAWVLALYPEGILLGSSQMREPFLIGLGCIAFWAALQWRTHKLKAFLVYLASLTGLILISAPAGMIIGGTCLALVLLEFTITADKAVNRWTGIEVLAILGFGAVISGWMWLQPTLYYEVYQAQTGSGVLQWLFEVISPALRIPFVTAYGLLQPVLPAAIADPALPFWTVLGIIRAVGWYFMLPFMAYALFSITRSKKEKNGWILILVAAVFFIWTVVSSARAGGDQWDNPRYRTILLPWMAMIFAWTWLRIKAIHPAWFWRWVAVISVLTLGFTNWYFARAWDFGFHTSLSNIIAVIGILSGLILVSGVVWDWIHRPKKIKPAKELPRG